MTAALWMLLAVWIGSYIIGFVVLSAVLAAIIAVMFALFVLGLVLFALSAVLSFTPLRNVSDKIIGHVFVIAIVVVLGGFLLYWMYDHQAAMAALDQFTVFVTGLLDTCVIAFSRWFVSSPLYTFHQFVWGLVVDSFNDFKDSLFFLGEFQNQGTGSLGLLEWPINVLLSIAKALVIFLLVLPFCVWFAAVVMAAALTALPAIFFKKVRNLFRNVVGEITDAIRRPPVFAIRLFEGWFLEAGVVVTSFGVSGITWRLDGVSRTVGVAPINEMLSIMILFVGLAWTIGCLAFYGYTLWDQDPKTRFQNVKKSF